MVKATVLHLKKKYRLCFADNYLLLQNGRRERPFTNDPATQPPASKWKVGEVATSQPGLPVWRRPDGASASQRYDSPIKSNSTFKKTFLVT